MRRTAAPRGRGLLPEGQAKANSWASVVGKLPQRGNSKPNNNSRTLLRSRKVVNYDVDRIDANTGDALLRGGPQRAVRRSGQRRTPHRPIHTYLSSSGNNSSGTSNSFSAEWQNTYKCTSLKYQKDVILQQ